MQFAVHRRDFGTTTIATAIGVIRLFAAKSIHTVTPATSVSIPTTWYSVSCDEPSLNAIEKVMIHSAAPRNYRLPVSSATS